MRQKVLLFLLLVCAGAYTFAHEVTNSPTAAFITQNPVVLGQNYPNPAKNKTVITYEINSPEAVIRIYNVLGKMVDEIVVSKDKKMITLDVSDYQEGIYLYTIEADGQKLTRRMTVKK